MSRKRCFRMILETKFCIKFIYEFVVEQKRLFLVQVRVGMNFNFPSPQTMEYRNRYHHHWDYRLIRIIRYPQNLMHRLVF